MPFALIGIAAPASPSPWVMSVTVFVLALFVGFHVVWNVTPALHTPLMSVTNAISGIIIVGAILTAGGLEPTLSKGLGLTAVFLAAICSVGGFVVTQRMLSMFQKTRKPTPARKEQP